MSECFAKFGAFINALAKRSETPDEIAGAYDGFVRTVAQAQRFYVPSAARVVSRLDVSKGASASGSPALPYPALVLLDDAVDLGGGLLAGKPLRVLPRDWKAVVAIEDSDKKVIAIPFQHCGDRTVQLPAFVPRCDINGALTVHRLRGGNSDTPPAVYAAMVDAAAGLFNLCAMLATANTQTKKLCPRGSLDFARSPVGARPLYSYHVLVVNGERWDKPECKPAGDGIRSHLRRGHIRRFSTGASVWVRACFVRGSIAGFINKDYDVKVAM